MDWGRAALADKDCDILPRYHDKFTVRCVVRRGDARQYCEWRTVVVTVGAVVVATAALAVVIVFQVSMSLSLWLMTVTQLSTLCLAGDCERHAGSCTAAWQ